MNITNRHIKIITEVVLLTTFLSWFFYAHETLPKPIRAATSLIETPVAIASGLSHYLKLGVDVYESPAAMIISYLIASIIIIITGLIHLYRIIFPFRVMIENYKVPVFLSVAFVVLAVILCIGLWKESKTK